MILISKCLAGFPCRMDGQAKLVPEIRELLDSGRAVAVCPEVMGGLPTPREPSEIRNGRVVTQSGRDVTEAFVRGAEAALEVCLKNGCACAILKSRSPSCGCGWIHNGAFDGGLVPGNGVFARLLMDHGVRVMTEEEWLNSARDGN